MKRKVFRFPFGVHFAADSIQLDNKRRQLAGKVEEAAKGRKRSSGSLGPGGLSLSLFWRARQFASCGNLPLEAAPFGGAPPKGAALPNGGDTSERASGPTTKGKISIFPNVWLAGT